MTLAVIQDRPIIGFEGNLFIANFSDIIKYTKLCDHLIYCCSIEQAKSKDDVKKLKIADFPNVTFEEVIKNPIKEMFHISSFNMRKIEKVVDMADLIVIKCPSITIGKWAFDYIRKVGKPYILEIIACAWDAYWYHDIQGKLISFYSYYNAKKMVKKADNVIYVTNKFLQSRYPTKGNSLACSNVVLMDMDNSVLEERQNYISKRCNINRLKLGTVGALNVEFKGQQYVIKAISKLKKLGVFFDYYLVGGGSNKRLQKIAEIEGVQDQVHFVGRLPKDKMNTFYDNIDIYVHPSLAEGLPRVVIEAESRALPVCGANAAGTPELIDSDFVFEKQDVSDLCRILLSFNLENMLEQSKINFKRAHEYSLDILDDRRKVFYISAMS